MLASSFDPYDTAFSRRLEEAGFNDRMEHLAMKMAEQEMRMRRMAEGVNEVSYGQAQAPQMASTSTDPAFMTEYEMEYRGKQEPVVTTTNTDGMEPMWVKGPEYKEDIIEKPKVQADKIIKGDPELQDSTIIK